MVRDKSGSKKGPGMWLLVVFAIAALAMFLYSIFGGPDSSLPEEQEGIEAHETVDAIVPETTDLETNEQVQGEVR